MCENVCMRRRIALIIAGIGIFLLGALTASIVVWRLSERGLIFNVKSIPNPAFGEAKKGHYDEAIKLIVR